LTLVFSKIKHVYLFLTETNNVTKEELEEQYYPTYNSENRDILLIEFEEAQKIANGQSKVYGQVTNVLLAVATFAFTFLLDKENSRTSNALTVVFSNSIIFSVILFVFGAISLRYFVDLQKQITINARKVVTLRKLLGLNYGNIHLTLPNWRVEGATNPFVIKYFNGWLNFKSMPFWLLTITINAIWWLSIRNQSPIIFDIKTYQVNIYGLGYVFITLTYLFVFRRNLNDKHETTFLNFVKIFSKILRIRLIENFEYIIYRASLAYIELDRLNVNYKKLIKILIEIEDKNFDSNIGISFKSLSRGFLSRFKFFRKKYGLIEHGGSTITMQLTRTLFIPSNQNKYFRKVIEILLSIWLNKQFPKEKILRFYIASVRYDRGIMGLSNAIKHFFGEINGKELSNEESFFLIERLSNVTSTVRWERIDHLSTRTGIILDQSKLKEIYEKQITTGKLILNTNTEI
jgi:penicillin-binding protein 1A